MSQIQFTHTTPNNIELSFTVDSFYENNNYLYSYVAKDTGNNIVRQRTKITRDEYISDMDSFSVPYATYSAIFSSERQSSQLDFNFSHSVNDEYSVTRSYNGVSLRYNVVVKNIATQETIDQKTNLKRQAYIDYLSGRGVPFSLYSSTIPQSTANVSFIIEGTNGGFRYEIDRRFNGESLNYDVVIRSLPELTEVETQFNIDLVSYINYLNSKSVEPSLYAQTIPDKSEIGTSFLYQENIRRCEVQRRYEDSVKRYYFYYTLKYEMGGEAIESGSELIQSTLISELANAGINAQDHLQELLIPENYDNVFEDDSSVSSTLRYNINRYLVNATDEFAFDYTIATYPQNEVIEQNSSLSEDELITSMNNRNVGQERYTSVLIQHSLSSSFQYGGSSSIRKYRVTKYFSPVSYDLLVRLENNSTFFQDDDMTEAQLTDYMNGNGVPYNMYKSIIEDTGQGGVDEYVEDKNISFITPQFGGLPNVNGYEVEMFRFVDGYNGRFYSLSVKNNDNNVYLYKENLKYGIFEFIKICDASILRYSDYKDIIHEGDTGVFYVVNNMAKIIGAEMYINEPLTRKLNMSRVTSLQDVINVVGLLNVTVSKNVFDNLPDNLKFYFSN